MSEQNSNAALTAQNVSTSQGETMEAQSGSQAAQVNEGATTMVAGENNNNTHSNNSEIMENSKEASVINVNNQAMEANNSMLRQEVKDALKELNDYNGDKKTVRSKLITAYNKALKALKSYIEQQVLPVLPVQLWRTESDEKDAIMIAKEEREIIIAVSNYNLQTKSAAIKMAKQCLTDKHFELNAPKYVTPAELLYNAGIELIDLNGNIIPKNTPNVFVPVGGADEHAIFFAAHKMNIDAEINDTPKIILRNICVKTFDNMQELGKYIGYNTVLERALNGMEQAGIAALATENELCQKVHKVSIEKRWSKSTTEKYYRLGARMTTNQWKNATCGILPNNIEYDLSVGDKIIETLISKGFKSIIGSRYIIDAIASFSKVKPFGKSEEYGIDTTLALIEQITPEEVQYILNTSSDKTDVLFNWLSQKQAENLKQAA